jgi:hypothetical protein
MVKLVASALIYFTYDLIPRAQITTVGLKRLNNQVGAKMYD